MSFNQKIKLLFISLLKYLFAIITVLIQYLLIIIELIILLISFKKVNFNFSSNFADFCIGVHKKILNLEFKIIFKK